MLRRPPGRSGGTKSRMMAEDRLLEARNLVGSNVEPNGPRLAGRPRDESETIKRQDHLVNHRRRDLEVALEVSLCRWTTVHFRVRVDECEILALQVREVGHRHVISRPVNALTLHRAGGEAGRPVEASVSCVLNLH